MRRALKHIVWRIPRGCVFRRCYSDFKILVDGFKSASRKMQEECSQTGGRCGGHCDGRLSGLSLRLIRDCFHHNDGRKIHSRGVFADPDRSVSETPRAYRAELKDMMRPGRGHEHGNVDGRVQNSSLTLKIVCPRQNDTPVRGRCHIELSHHRRAHCISLHCQKLKPQFMV